MESKIRCTTCGKKSRTEKTRCSNRDCDDSKLWCEKPEWNINMVEDNPVLKYALKLIDEAQWTRKELEKYAGYTGETDDEGAKLAIKNDAWKQCESLDQAIRDMKVVLEETR